VTSAMLVSLTAMTDCRLHWAAPLTSLVIAESFSGVQLAAGALVSHLDLAPRHAGVIAAVTGTAGASTYFLRPAFTRVLRAARQVPAVRPSAPSHHGVLMYRSNGRYQPLRPVLADTNPNRKLNPNLFIAKNAVYNRK